MTDYYGDFPEDHVAVRIPFNTFSSDDPSASVTITNLADADIMVHKDGGLTQIATDGATVVIDFDGITGNHMVTIDTSVDAAYSTGSEYAVRIEGTTIDGGTINAWIGSFSIERAGGVLALVKALNDFDPANDDVAVVTLVGTTTTNTDMVGTDGANTTVPDVAGTAATPAEVATALTDIHLDHLLAVDYDPASKPGTSTALLNELVESDAGVSRYTVNALENAPSGSGASAAAIADAVWDEVLTGSSHNTATSAGRRLRQLDEAFVMAEGVIATATNTHTFTLDTGAVATADYYIGARLQIEEGTGAGQSRVIAAYSVGRVAILDSDFTTIPDTSSRYSIVAADVQVSISDLDLGTGFVAVYTNTTTITLDTTQAPATTDFYVGEIIVFTHGVGAGQAREITAYTSGRVITMAPALITDLDTTTTWHIVAAVSIPEIVTEINASTIGTEVTSTLEDTGTTLPATLGTPTDTDLATDLANIQTAADAIPTTAMRGTDNAATETKQDIIDTNVDDLKSGIIFGVAETGTLSTTAATTDLTGFTDDQLKGRTIIFLAGPADGEGATISDYASASGLITFTDTPLTLAPENGNAFKIV